MIVKMIKMDFLHKSSVGSELSICIYISSSAIVRIREHVKQCSQDQTQDRTLVEKVHFNHFYYDQAT